MSSLIGTQTHVDGTVTQFRRAKKQGRPSLPVEIKAAHKTISLMPYYNEKAKKWKELTGIDFSSWVEDKMYEELKYVSELVKQ